MTLLREKKCFTFFDEVTTFMPWGMQRINTFGQQIDHYSVSNVSSSSFVSIKVNEDGIITVFHCFCCLSPNLLNLYIDFIFTPYFFSLDYLELSESFFLLVNNRYKMSENQF